MGKVLHINSPLTLSLHVLLYPCLWKIFEETLQILPKMNSFLGRNLLGRFHRGSFVCRDWQSHLDWGIWGNPIPFPSGKTIFPASLTGLICAGVEGEGAAPHPHVLFSQIPFHRQHHHPSAYLGCFLSAHHTNEHRLRAADQHLDCWVSSGESTTIPSSFFQPMYSTSSHGAVPSTSWGMHTPSGLS